MDGFNVKIVVLTIILSTILFYLNIYKLFETYFNNTLETNTISLVIGVLSARNNFDYRDSVRKSFVQQLSKHNNSQVSVSHYFIIGDKDCPYPQNDRVNQYSCDKWEVTLQDSNDVFSSSLDEPEVIDNCKFAKIIKTVTFKVGKLAIRINKLGILASFLIPNEPVFVILTDKYTKEVYAKAKFVIDENFNEESENYHKGYLYRDINEFVYPPGFNGVLTVKGTTISEYDYNASTSFCSHLNSGGNLIKFDDSNLDKVPVTALGFKVHNEIELKNHIENAENRSQSWLKKLTEIESKLKEESAKYGDIIFVGLIDVYHNLPLKLLNFFAWLTKNHKLDYFLKTDDDCSINIELISSQLIKLHNEAKKETNKLWWGNFRKDWLVNRVGKWTDDDYPSNTYPIFACGSGNVMSKYLVNWLAQNKEHLYTFQGEDVSLGIWLSAILPQYIEDDKFSCDETCDKNSYVKAQLTPKEMQRSDKLLQQCGSICTCDKQ